MSEHVRVAIEDNILRLTLARPEKKNALSMAMYSVLGEALTKAETDPQVRAILIAAEGDAFTAGNDLADFAAVASGKLDRKDMTSHLLLNALARADKPVIAAVQGLAVGIGVTLLLHCDLVYVAADARLSTPFVSLGLVPEAASSWLLQARIGYARAYAMMALGESLDGTTAVTLGIANAAVPASEVRARALAAAQQVVARPIGALQATKRLMRDSEAIRAVMEREGEVFAARLRTAEAAEALRAFAERRAPNFRGIVG
ncbi:MAG: enoyl-CoA hydratase-related protein [Steroidobacteraceae bacterium]